MRSTSRFSSGSSSSGAPATSIHTHQVTSGGGEDLYQQAVDRKTSRPAATAAPPRPMLGPPENRANSIAAPQIAPSTPNMTESEIQPDDIEQAEAPVKQIAKAVGRVAPVRTWASRMTTMIPKASSSARIAWETMPMSGKSGLGTPGKLSVPEITGISPTTTPVQSPVSSTQGNSRLSVNPSSSAKGIEASAASMIQPSLRGGGKLGPPISER